jgi:hypothetical protein
LAVRALAVLGRTEDAFALMERPLVQKAMANVNNGFLLEPSTAQLRQDPRFWPVAARVGLVAYWTQRRAWPDFCGREVDLADCKAAAGAALSQAQARSAAEARIKGANPLATREMRGFAR